MYTAFAENDTSTLRKICLDGIYESFRSRIGVRPRGEKVVWELVKYNSSPRIASNRAARLPIEGAAIRQAVVRIASKQKLTRWVKNKDTGKMEVAKGSGKEKDVVEYLVIQRQYEGWREGEWKVWGTTNESTLADVEEWQRKLLE
jgi:protein MBA1